MDINYNTRHGFLPQPLRLAILAFAVYFMNIPAGYGQQAKNEMVLSHVQFKVISAEVVRFEKPVRLGAGKRLVEYQEALLFAIEVRQKDYEELPPSIEPLLYIGTREYHIYGVHQSRTKGMLTLVFHIRDWQDISDKSPMILTIQHGVPISSPDLRSRLKLPLFDRAVIRDKRLQ